MYKLIYIYIIQRKKISVVPDNRGYWQIFKDYIGNNKQEFMEDIHIASDELLTSRPITDIRKLVFIY